MTGTSFASLLPTLIQCAIAPLAAVGLAYLTIWVASRARHERVQDVRTRLVALVGSVVKAVEQSHAGPGSGAAKKAKATALLKSHLGDKGIAEIRKVLRIADVDDYLAMLTESHVYEIQEAAPAFVPEQVTERIAAAIETGSSSGNGTPFGR